MEIEIHQLPQSLKLRQNQLIDIVNHVSQDVDLNADSISYIFVDDDYLAQMHSRYLDDPHKTDVITFNLGDNSAEGEIYISYERALQQSKQFNVSFEEEIIRLLIHGLLHLAGYDDLEKDDRDKMKEVENSLLNKYFNNI